MTTPTAPAPTLAIATDKPTYNVGDPIEVTLTYDDGTAVQVQLVVTAVGSDAAGNSVTAQASAQVNTTQPGPMTFVVTDNFGDSYGQVSNDGIGNAEFSSTRGHPASGMILTITAVGTDAAGRTATASVSVTVNVPGEQAVPREGILDRAAEELGKWI